MTVPSDAAQPPRITYVEDGATLVRNIPFTFEDATDLTLTRLLADGSQVVLTLFTDYVIAGGAGATGSATMVAAGIVGDTLQIDRDTPRDQLSDYEPGDDFPADRIEGDFDKVVRIVQELARDLLHKHDVQTIIAAMLQQGAGISLTVNATGDALTIASTVDVYAGIKAALEQGAGITISADDVLKRITISADGIEGLPDCWELSGDEQTNTGGGTGAGGELTTANVITIIQDVLAAGAGIGLAFDAGTNILTVTNTSPAGYTDENARDAIGAALVSGTLINIVVDDAGNTITINCTALNPSYRGLAVVDEAGAFDFDDTHGGKSILYTGGAAAATLRLDAVHALSDGWGTVLRNKGTGTVSLAFDAGVSIMVNGAVVAATTISLAIGAVATINRWGANDFTLSGNVKVSST